MSVSPQVFILQHPSEVKNAKNSARLVKLGIPNTQIIVGEQPQDFLSAMSVSSDAAEQTAVFYPSPDSQALEAHSEQFRHAQFKRLIFIDATWRKAYKMWQLNPWLHEFACWHFASPPESRYQIRKANVSNSLSTLEAVGYVLEQGFDLDASSLIQLFEVMQQGQLIHRNP